MAVQAYLKHPSHCLAISRLSVLVYIFKDGSVPLCPPLNKRDERKGKGVSFSFKRMF